MIMSEVLPIRVGNIGVFPNCRKKANSPNLFCKTDRLRDWAFSDITSKRKFFSVLRGDSEDEEDEGEEEEGAEGEQIPVPDGMEDEDGEDDSQGSDMNDSIDGEPLDD